MTPMNFERNLAHPNAAHVSLEALQQDTEYGQLNYNNHQLEVHADTLRKHHD